MKRFVVIGLGHFGSWIARALHREDRGFERGERGALRVPADAIACRIAGIDIQGEGVAWLDAERLVLTSERALRPSGTIAIVRCPLPRAGAATAARNP